MNIKTYLKLENHLVSDITQLAKYLFPEVPTLKKTLGVAAAKQQCSRDSMPPHKET